jgi:hypothetical protein
LAQALNSRIETYRKGKIEAVLSTAIFWAVPFWATSYNDIYLFIKRYCEGREGEETDV